MKKIAIIFTALLLAMCFSMSVFAASSGFVSSPSNNQAPELVEFSSSSSECSAQIKITSYADRKTLSDDSVAKIEKAYADIAANTDLSKLCEALKDHSADLSVPVEELAVSDLFDISYANCEDHAGHGAFIVTIKPEYLEKFVALLHYNGTSWELVESAEIEDEDKLVFTVSELSPFAIVVSTDTVPVYKSGTVGSMIAVGGIASAVAVAGFIIFFIIGKKKKKEDEENA